MDERCCNIFTLLEGLLVFPNYQLERRADIFFTYFLPEILAGHFKNDFKASHQSTDKHKNIIPEFPLWEGKENSKKVESLKRKNIEICEGCEDYFKTRHSVKTDYAFFDIDGGTVYLIELKTTNESINKNQINRLIRLKEDQIKEEKNSSRIGKT